MRTWVLGNLGNWVLRNLGTWELRDLGASVIANLGTWNFGSLEFGNLGNCELGYMGLRVVLGILGSWELEYTWVNEYLGTCAFRKFGFWVHTLFKDNFNKQNL